MLEYSLVENMLTERPDDYSAQIHPAGSLNEEDIIDRMLSKGTLATRTDIVAISNLFVETVAEAVGMGYNVVHPLFNIFFFMSGVFDNLLDTYDGNRHKVNVNLSKGVKLRETEKKVKVQKTNSPSPQPQIQEVKDSITGVVNETLTAQGVVEVRGYNLKIEGDNPSCGLWFVHENGEETKATIIIENKPSKIFAMIPALADGTYQIKIVTQFSGSNLLKTPKVFTYLKHLEVKK